MFLLDCRVQFVLGAMESMPVGVVLCVSFGNFCLVGFSGGGGHRIHPERGRIVVGVLESFSWPDSRWVGPRNPCRKRSICCGSFGIFFLAGFSVGGAPEPMPKEADLHRDPEGSKEVAKRGIQITRKLLR